MTSLLSTFYFHLFRYFSYHPQKKDKILYLTFDDGPEKGITEFVLNELAKYNAKATFFCCGKNCEANPELFQRILKEKHSIANHTYSHIRGLRTPTNDYLQDIDRCAQLCNTTLFRPPWGSLNIRQYFLIKKKGYRIVYWTLSSGDTSPNICNLKEYISKWDKKVTNGDIILFHFCNHHETNTKILLPLFLELMAQKGYQFKAI